MSERNPFYIDPAIWDRLCRSPRYTKRNCFWRWLFSGVPCSLSRYVQLMNAFDTGKDD